MSWNLRDRVSVPSRFAAGQREVGTITMMEVRLTDGKTEYHVRLEGGQMTTATEDQLESVER